MRLFQNADGTRVEVRCASVAVLEITHSPVHVHGATLEHYLVLGGSGKMLLGAVAAERLLGVVEGSLIVIPPGQPQGLMSTDPAQPVKVLLTFTPGIAPTSSPQFRDEKILFERTSAHVQKLENRAQRGISTE